MIRISPLACLLLCAACTLPACGQDSSSPPNEPHTAAGGQLTIRDRTSHAFTKPAPELSDDELTLHLDGDRAFETQFVSSGERFGGLGPQFNNNSCNACHIRNGRGMPVIGHPSLRSSMLVRVSLPDHTNSPLPGIGMQLRDHAIHGHEPDARIALHWIEEPGQYPDGTPFSLRRPELTITLPDGQPLPTHILTSLRQTPPILGLGLLEAVPEATILALEDPDDHDGDGISGRANRVWHPATNRTVLGRFGLKANEPDLSQQTAAAFFNDIGITTPHPINHDQTPEITQNFFDSAVFYAQSLAVPERRQPQTPAAHRGEQLFTELACAKCHIPELKTGPSDFDFLANQRFRPYTDLLLHDMGPGLADNRPDALATGTEWRTAPLWGIGLTQTVLPGAAYLHDGRARTIEEAILWHGGEAQTAQQSFQNLSTTERNDLLEFLQGL